MSRNRWLPSAFARANRATWSASEYSTPLRTSAPATTAARAGATDARVGACGAEWRHEAVKARLVASRPSIARPAVARAAAVGGFRAEKVRGGPRSSRDASRPPGAASHESRSAFGSTIRRVRMARSPRGNAPATCANVLRPLRAQLERDFQCVGHRLVPRRTTHARGRLAGTGRHARSAARCSTRSTTRCASTRTCARPS